MARKRKSAKPSAPRRDAKGRFLPKRSRKPKVSRPKGISSDFSPETVERTVRASIAGYSLEALERKRARARELADELGLQGKDRIKFAASVSLGRMVELEASVTPRSQAARFFRSTPPSALAEADRRGLEPGTPERRAFIRSHTIIRDRATGRFASVSTVNRVVAREKYEATLRFLMDEFRGPQGRLLSREEAQVLHRYLSGQLPLTPGDGPGTMREAWDEITGRIKSPKKRAESDEDETDPEAEGNIGG